MEKETDKPWKEITIEGDNVIPLTIYNTKQLILPATGGSGFGLVTMGGIALMAQAILMGTYFTLQCRKGDDKLRKKRQYPQRYETQAVGAGAYVRQLHKEKTLETKYGAKRTKQEK